MPNQKRARTKPVPIHSARERRRTFKRWLRSFKQVKAAVFDLTHKRHIYREVTAIIQANPRLNVPSAFYDWMRRVYITDMTIDIRKLVDWDRRTVSFVTLMQEIEDHPEVISRRRYVSKYRGLLRRYGNRDFERFAKPGAEFIDRKIIRRHRRELIDSQRRLREFVNRHVAHRSRYLLRRLPTYSELDACVDLIGKLLKEYALLLEQIALTKIVPVIQYDWKAPFRVPWIDAKKVERMY